MSSYASSYFAFSQLKKMKLSREENRINYPRALENPLLPWEGCVLVCDHFLNKYFTSKSFIAEDFEANK